ncbi:hypothetical protein [Halobiforma nitratireducens]|uniref:Uncharacterized protein n=1 Tax=Halobiforma nitratireducens JCM 10879 TaxID=1227454 RepID=M0LBJ8_9EURY|nr:hypothetical protein [Halobiforma nitratireducens]EMA29340.1 hypothetical protein C446_17324 [Halobiforma nitratireducens JCM 10879]
MSKALAILSSYSGIAAKTQRTIEHSPDFSGVQTSDRGQPDRQVPAGGFLTG